MSTKVTIDGKERTLELLSKTTVKKYIVDYLCESFGQYVHMLSSKIVLKLGPSAVPQTFTSRTLDVFELLENASDTAFKSFGTIATKDKLLPILSVYTEYLDVFYKAIYLYNDTITEFLTEEELSKILEEKDENLLIVSSHLEYIVETRFERKKNVKKRKRQESDGDSKHKSSRVSKRRKTKASSNKRTRTSKKPE